MHDIDFLVPAEGNRSAASSGFRADMELRDGGPGAVEELKSSWDGVADGCRQNDQAVISAGRPSLVLAKDLIPPYATGQRLESNCSGKNSALCPRYEI